MAEAILTKRALVSSLKKMTFEKEYDKITVGEITEDCGVNRQTFYYHFQDKNEMLRWAYEDSYFCILEGIDYDNWYEKVFDVFYKMKQEQRFCASTVVYAREFMYEFFIQAGEQIFGTIIEEEEEKKTFSEEREFAIRFFANGVSGSIIDWVLAGMKQSPEQIATLSRRILHSVKKGVDSMLI